MVRRIVKANDNAKSTLLLLNPFLHECMVHMIAHTSQLSFVGLT